MFAVHVPEFNLTCLHVHDMFRKGWGTLGNTDLDNPSVGVQQCGDLEQALQINCTKQSFSYQIDFCFKYTKLTCRSLHSITFVAIERIIRLKNRGR